MEAEKNKPKFFEEVNETWLMLLQRFGWMVLFYMGYKIYNSLETNPDFGLLDGILVFVLGGLGALIVGYILAIIFTPLIGIDKKRIVKYEGEKNVIHLLGMILTPSTSKLWLLACDAVVRLGNSNVPLLFQALDKETCPIKNPMGFKIASNSNLRAGAAYCLGKLKEQSAVNALILALDDNENDVRMVAAQALGEIGDKSALNKLGEIAQNDKNEEVKNVATKAIDAINQIGS